MMTAREHHIIFGFLLCVGLGIAVLGICWGFGIYVYENWDAVARVFWGTPSWLWVTLAGIAFLVVVVITGAKTDPEWPR